MFNIVLDTEQIITKAAAAAVVVVAAAGGGREGEVGGLILHLQHLIK